MIKTKSPIFSFKNTVLTLTLKSIFLFSTGVYILSLPAFYFKFNLVDGVNVYGYASPAYVLVGEVIFCFILSGLSFLWSFINLKKLYGECKNGEK